MEQLDLKLANPRRINVDGVFGTDGHILYIGEATQQFNGTWRALANVFGALCVVEVDIKFEEKRL